MAWALVRIFRRLESVGLRTGQSVPLPYRQQDMADALGLSLVHTNKTLASLRTRKLANWAGGQLTLPSLEAIADLAKVNDEPPSRRPIL